MSVASVGSVAELEALAAKVEDGVLVVEFAADWSDGSQQMSEVVTELASECSTGKVSFCRVEAESVPELSLRFGVTAVPTVAFVRSSDLSAAYDRLDGLHAAALTKKCRGLKDGDLPPPPKADGAKACGSGEAKACGTASCLCKAPEAEQDLDSRLKALIGRHRVMLFMKGEPGAPQCGFSRTIVGLLEEAGADFRTFDILSDPDVREGLKKFSNWPTYPQLYLDGELLGGLDIVKEMVASGELDLPKKLSLDQRLKSLIKRSKLMVFMKGEPSAPRCKFSKALMEILKAEGLPFDSFDILGDEEVREGLKKLSNWPTYPQVYVDGELVGGIDIIKELKEAGELASTLKGE